MNKTTFPLIAGLTLCLASACGDATAPRQVDRSRVVANPIDVDYPIEAAPDPSADAAMMAAMAAAMADPASLPPSYTLPDNWQDLLRNLDPNNPYPTEEEVRVSLLTSMHSGFSTEAMPAADVTGSRTGADPVMARFQDWYFLFHSGAEGYWISGDMQHWSHIDTNLPAGIAPSVMVYGDEMYYVTSRINQIYHTATPTDGMSWEPIDAAMTPFKDNPAATAHDPYFFTEDGRVYFYWECDYLEPIKVIEMDPQNHFFPKDNPKEILHYNRDRLGYEVAGHRNELYLKGGYNEGPIMTKYDGRYYLQYATGGTEFDAYADGVYVSDSPMGPFELLPSTPMSLRMGGFTTGAGHGDTFQDEYGNWWHLSTNCISQRKNFERRISLYPVVFTEKGNMYALTWLGDYPFELPRRKVDFLSEDIHTGWMNLSIGKAVIASSELPGYEAERAADNTIKTWWAAETGHPGEYLQVDLGHPCTVQAIQPNFADHNFGYGGEDQPPYRYTIKGSLDGENWKILVDKTDNRSLRPHELLVLDQPAEARFIRLTNCGELAGQFSSFDLRVFGSGQGDAPQGTAITAIDRPTSNPRRMTISWAADPTAYGYLLRWGTDPDELLTSMEVYGQTSVELGCFDGQADYWFTIDSLNENGITRGSKTVSAPAQ